MVGIAIGVALVLIAAGVGTFMLLRGDDSKPVAQPSTSPSASSPSSPAPSDSGDDTHGGSGAGTKPVVPGWKAVTNGDQKVAFDVPQDWVVKSRSWVYSVADEQGNPVVGMASPAAYKENYCNSSPLAATGTRKSEHAKNLKDAAESDAKAWAYYGYADLNTGNKGTLKSAAATPFTNAHGINGYASSATLTNVPKTQPCATDGAAFTVAWTGSENQTVVWVLNTAIDVPDTVPTTTIQTIEESIRPIS